MIRVDRPLLPRRGAIPVGGAHVRPARGALDTKPPDEVPDPSILPSTELRKMLALSRDAGRFVLSEPELQAELAEREAAGTLRCAVCGQTLAAHDAGFWRQRLDHRWATLPVHRTCLTDVAPWPGPCTGAGQRDADPVAPAAKAEAPAPDSVPLRAMRGRLAGRIPLGAVVLQYPGEDTALDALIRLGLGDAVPAQDFDPVHGRAVRAVHALFPDTPVFPTTHVEVRVQAATASTLRVAVCTADTTLWAEVDGAGTGHGEPVRLVLLQAASSFTGPDGMVAALLCGEAAATQDQTP